MRRSFIAWMAGILVVTLGYAIPVTQAQNKTKVSVKFLSEEEILLSEKNTRPLLIKKEKQVLHGQILFSEDKTKVSLPNRPSFELPHVLETVVAQNGQTIVQYGDELDQSHPRRTNIYWTNNSGKAAAKVVDYYAEEALVSLSDDGFTAVTGRLFKDRNNTVLSLYSPLGEKLWEKVLNKNQRPAIVRVTEGGNHITLVTTDKNKWLEDHRLHIFDKQATSISSLDAFGIIQKVVVVDAGQHLFVQGYDDYGLIEIERGLILWRKKQKIRMTSPYGARITAEGRVLFLALANFQGKRQAAYQWKLVVLNTSDGAEQASVSIPGEYPGTRYQVFELISPESVQIRTPSKRFTYSWQEHREGK